jgi:3-oxoacyl-[acyl-carrier protein] reductase
MFEATGRLALVTGAGRGVGVGIARTLGHAGASVAVNDLHADRCERTASVLRDEGVDARAVPFDITSNEAVVEGVAAVVDAFGQSVDILVNNAGVPEGMAVTPFREMDPTQWGRYIDLNVYGSMRCIHAVLDPMCDQGWGRIIQISSGAGRTGLAFGVSLYGASKSGIEGFIRHLAQEVARNGVTVNSIALGLMDPGPSADGRESAMAPMARTVPVGRLGTGDDVGATAAFLASNEAAWLTSQTINLNGGATMN